MRASIRPRGPRAAGDVKIKALELLPWPAAVAQGQFGLAWKNYVQQDLPTRLAFMKGLGANATKTALNGMVESNFPPAPLFEIYVQDFCDLLRAYGLRVYLALAGPNEFAGSDTADRNYRVGRMADSMSIFMKHGSDLLVGIDLANEINFHRPARWVQDQNSVDSAMADDLTYFMNTIRTATGGTVPLSFSVWTGGRQEYNGRLFKFQADLGCDFHDYHGYQGGGGTNTTVAMAPKGADMAQLEAQPWFIGKYFNGECGILHAAAEDAKEAFIAGMAEQAARPASLGGVFFGDRDYVGINEDGGFGLTGFPREEAAFKAWSYSQI